MKETVFVLCALLPYLICGINPAIVLAHLIYHEDIRTRGSGNPGFTNFKRLYGFRYAWCVMVLDLAKAVLSCLAAGALFSAAGIDAQLGCAYAGLFSVLGHCYPVWYGFHGGKSFLVGLAGMWCVDAWAGFAATLLLVLFLFTLHYMSLAAIVSSVGGVITLWLLGVKTPLTLALCIAGSLLLIFRHRKNIVRLCRGQETKFYFRGGAKEKNKEEEQVKLS